MANDNLIIKIPNFRLNQFKSILKESLIVNNQLMLEFNTQMIKSCSVSITQSFMKLWTMQLADLINMPDEIKDELSLDAPVKQELNLDFPFFEFYILKGDNFVNCLGVHNADIVDLEFTIKESNGKYQATSIKITGTSDENNSPLSTTFILTTEELMSAKIYDYNLIIKECTPDNSMIEFIILDKQIKEIKTLIKSLHKSLPNNTGYLTFGLDFKQSKLNINDKVFNISFNLNLKNQSNFDNIENFEFNILKTDLVMINNHNYSFFVNNTSQKVIMATAFSSSLIWCLTGKVSEADQSLKEGFDSASITDLEISEYF